MMIKRSVPDAKTIALEERQLSACRRGVLFLAAGLIAQLFVSATQVLSSPPAGDLSEFQTPGLSFYVLHCAVVLLAMIPGAGMMLQSARSRRWRRAAVGLTVLFLIETALVVVASRLMPLDQKIAPPAPLAARIVFCASSIVGWFEFWFMAVLIAEFALACRAQLLVLQTERLGYTILIGLFFELAVDVVNLALPFEAISSNELYVFAEACQQIILAATFAWTIYLLAMTAALARLLAERCGNLQPPVDEIQS